jgi:hypothetical protein
MISIQGPSNPKYKTSLCKKFETGKGCPYGDRCQFAHGSQELRLIPGQELGQNGIIINNQNNKVQNSILNFKIVKCKNWEKDRTCKYGAHCTFAHGDSELRNKGDNLYQMNPGFPMMMPMMMPSQGMDLNQMQQIMMSNQLMMTMGINPNMNMNMFSQNNGIPVERKE